MKPPRAIALFLLASVTLANVVGVKLSDIKVTGYQGGLLTMTSVAGSGLSHFNK